MKKYEVTENGEVVGRTAIELVMDYITEYVRVVESREEWKGTNYIGNLVVHEDEEAEADGYTPQINGYEPSVRLARTLFVYHFERETNDEYFLKSIPRPGIRKGVETGDQTRYKPDPGKC